MNLNYQIWELRTFNRHYIGKTFAFFLCRIKTYNNACVINEQTKVDLVLIYSITPISAALITEYLNKHVLFTQCLFLINRTKTFISAKKEER